MNTDSNVLVALAVLLEEIFEEELIAVEKYEPKLFVAVNNIFGDSYEYTRKYKRIL